MTSHDPGPSSAASTPGLSRALNIAGIAIVAVLLWRADVLAQPLWVPVLAGVGLVGWLVRDLLSSASPLGLAAGLVGIAASSSVAASTTVTGYIAGLVCIAALLATPTRSLALGLTSAVGSAVLVALDGLLTRSSAGVLLGAGAALVIVTLLGISRRQSRATAAQERQLLVERLRLEEERSRTAALAERSRIARDIHDVLAHSLGGLVIQLDAVEALLERGDAEEAHVRASAARGLAASGLDEARRAVDALRDPDAADDLPAALADLVATHRSLGADAELRATGKPATIGPDAAGALRGAAQELLSNARRHAPGERTDVELAWGAASATLTASTPLAAETPTGAPGGGRGLTGLRERAVAAGGSADWAVRDRAFVVTVTVPALGATAPAGAAA